MARENIDVFIRVRNRITVEPEEMLTLGKLAEIATEKNLQEKISAIQLAKAPLEAKKPLIISALQILYRIKQQYPFVQIHHVSGTDVLVFVEPTKDKGDQPSFLVIVSVAILLFIGSGMAIMNFHADVSMPLVHQRIYTLLTGEYVINPLILQIPYSIGIGLGMLVFFNHIFHKKFNDEPSPLEVEMFLYQQNVNKCMVWNKEEQESDKEKR